MLKCYELITYGCGNLFNRLKYVFTHFALIGNSLSKNSMKVVNTFG
jgi:hypothetical protein